MKFPVFPCKPICGDTKADYSGFIYPHTAGVPSDLFTEKFFRIVKSENNITAQLLGVNDGSSCLVVDAFVWSPELQNSSVYARFTGSYWQSHMVNGAW